ncbi:MAG: lytic murein transglycosylase [Paracoccaceae bacterium]|nr:lytic murein transglycosylase [Paracoccaceae bacterium]
MGITETPCGGSFDSFILDVKKEARSLGYSPNAVDQFFASATKNPKVLKADRAQGVFQMPFVDFSRRLISQNRMNTGGKKAAKYSRIFDQMETEYGVSRGVLLAFWAFETDYGGFQGNFNTLNALVTLAHDCRRPHLFRPQVFAALELYQQGGFDPVQTTGAWAGEIGMVQMLPEDILTSGVDGDGDGQVSLKTSAPDALLSGAQMLRRLGWQANQPWLEEIIVPTNLDWSLTGLGKTRPVSDWAALGVVPRAGSFAAPNLPANVVLPQGRNGPAFLAYPNFDVYFEWNQSFIYVTTAAYFATRLEGAPIFDAGMTDVGLTPPEMKLLQQRLQGYGYDVGDVDGILGAKTRTAIQDVQQRLGLPADAWPTPDLLDRL